MDDYKKALEKCILFKNFFEKDILNTLNSIKYKIKQYNKNETIALEGDNCFNLGIVLDGHIQVQKLFSCGKSVTITQLNPGDIFGEVILFSSADFYPATIISPINSKILFIKKDDIIALCSLNSLFLKNLMSLLSNKILMLNKKIKHLSYNTIRQKISSYLLDEYNKQLNLKISLCVSRQGLADILGIPRPSLSRELIKMKQDNILNFHKNTITLKSIKKLENLLT